MLQDRCPRASGSIRSSNLAADIVGLAEEPGKVAVIAAGHGWDSPVASTGGLFTLDWSGDVSLSAAE